jgi:hypothetical protein
MDYAESRSPGPESRGFSPYSNMKNLTYNTTGNFSNNTHGGPMRNNFMETHDSMGHEGSHVEPELESNRGAQRQVGPDSESRGGL